MKDVITWFWAMERRLFNSLLFISKFSLSEYLNANEKLIFSIKNSMRRKKMRRKKKLVLRFDRTKHFSELKSTFELQLWRETCQNIQMRIRTWNICSLVCFFALYVFTVNALARFDKLFAILTMFNDKQPTKRKIAKIVSIEIFDSFVSKK